MSSGLIFNIQKYSIHDGPGIRSTVFLKGCPLRCAWCHNPEGIAPEPEVNVLGNRCAQCGECGLVCPHGKSTGNGSTYAKPERCIHCGACVKVCPTGARQLIGRQMDVDCVMAEVLKDRIFYEESGGGVTFSGGEPFLQPVFLRDLLTQCRAAGIHTAVDTSGYVPKYDLLEAAPLVDLFLYDLKLMDDKLHQQWTGVSNVTILENLIALGGVHGNIWIRIPIVPKVNDAPEQIEALARFIGSAPGISQVNLLPYHGTAAHKWLSLSGQNRPIAEDILTQRAADFELAGEFSDNMGQIPIFGQALSAQTIDRVKETFQNYSLNTKIGG